MTPAQFAALLTEYGNLSHQCGYWQGDSSGVDCAEYIAKCEAAKQAVLDAYMEVSGER